MTGSGAVVLVAGLAAMLVASAVLPVALGGFDAASGGTAASGSGVVAEAVDGACSAAGPTGPTTTCSPSVDLLPAPNGSSPSTASSTVTNTGSLPVSTSVGLTACGVATVATSGSAATTAVVHGGISSAGFDSPGPIGGRSLLVSGGSGFVGASGSSATGLQQFTMLAWVRAGPGQGGGILSFSNTTSPASATDYDRHLWIDGSGAVVVGVYPGSVQEAVGTSVVTNGAWHLVAATLGPSGLSLYVDGRRQAANAAATSAQAYSGWWSVGAAKLAGWANAPTLTNGVSTFTGSLAGVAVLPAALTASQVTMLARSTSFGAYAASVAGATPVEWWPLQDAAPTPVTSGVGLASSLYLDSSSAGDSGTAVGAVTTAASGGPLGGGATSFPGGTAYIQTGAPGVGFPAVNGPQQFTLLAWVRAGPGQGGGILGFSNATSPTSASSWDRLLWIDGSGAVVAGVYPGSVQEAVGTSLVTNGAWHLVAATLGPSGLSLYVDGTPQAVNAAATSAQAYSGWWSVGAARLASWANAPALTNGVSTFTGSLAGVAVLPTALSATQIAELAATSTFPAYAAVVAADAPLADWTLQTELTAPCQGVLATVAATVGATTTCIAPAAPTGVACPSATAGIALQSLLGTPALETAVLPAAATASFAITLVDAPGLPVSYAGVQLAVDVDVGVQAGTWTVAVDAPGSWSEL